MSASRLSPTRSRRQYTHRSASLLLLELGKGLSFFLSLFSLYGVATVAFFTPTMHWRERLVLMLARTLLAALICTLSGLLFTASLSGNPDRRAPIMRSLPVQLFLWTIPIITTLSALSWYFLCGCAAWSYEHYFACR